MWMISMTLLRRIWHKMNSNFCWPYTHAGTHTPRERLMHTHMQTKHTSTSAIFFWHNNLMQLNRHPTQHRLFDLIALILFSFVIVHSAIHNLLNYNLGQSDVITGFNWTSIHTYINTYTRTHKDILDSFQLAKWNL